MNRSTIFRVLFIFLAYVPAAASVSARVPALHIDAAPTGQIEFASVVVNGRTLTGPNSAAHRRGGRLLVPMMAIARGLGDVVNIEVTSQLVQVRQQTGISTEFDIRLGQVRENGSPILTVSNLGDIQLTPNADEFLLPVEIASALFDVTIRYDSVKTAVIVGRGEVQTDLTPDKGERRFADIYQLDYEYDLNRYSSGSSHNLIVTAAGRLGDGRFNFSSNSSRMSGRAFALRNSIFRFERPNGQRYFAGDFGTGANLQFLSTYLRGGSASIPVGDKTVTAFAGRAYSGVMVPVNDPSLNATTATARGTSRFDTSIFGVFATTDAADRGFKAKPLTLSAGAMRFGGSKRSGELATFTSRYDVSRFRLQGDVAMGKFAGFRPDASRFTGLGSAVDLAGTFQVSDNLALQARYAHIGKNFLSPQAGLRDPLDLKAAGVTWSPAKWLSTAFNATVSANPGDKTQNNRFVTGAMSITPQAARLPRLFITHSQSGTSRTGPAAFTMVGASKDLSRLRLFLNASRIKTGGVATANGQLGANIAINDKNTLEVSQGLGSRRVLNGQIDWRVTNLFSNRFSMSLGSGYNYRKTEGFSTFERASASLKLPRHSSVQVNYYRTSAGPTMLLTFRGSLFRKKEASAFLDSPSSEMNSFGEVSGRVYQDIDQNGRFDPGVDRPQADVKVRIDGNQYVVSDINGLYKFDSVPAGEHKVYIDLLSVRADLTLLGDAVVGSRLLPGHSTTMDFRLVRTGRLSGRVWFDANENGKLDDGEKPLADIRVVTGSGRDTLTDSDGYFVIGDLTPGEHVILLDEKTMPKKSQSGSKPLAVQVFPGRETGDVNLSVIVTPAEIKRFGSAQKE